MNAALLVFTQIAIAGCGFLVYFLYALWRESTRRGKGPKVEIKPITTRVSKTKTIQLYTVEKSALGKLRGISGRS